MYNIQQLYKLNIAIFMHKFFNKQLPTAFMYFKQKHPM